MRYRRSLLMSALLIIALWSAPGCMVYRGVHVAGIEPCAGPLENRPFKIIEEAEAEISSFRLFWLVTVTPRPDFDRALREMSGEKGGDDVINIRTWEETQHWIVGTVFITHIKGTVIRYVDED